MLKLVSKVNYSITEAEIEMGKTYYLGAINRQTGTIKIVDKDKNKIPGNNWLPEMFCETIDSLLSKVYKDGIMLMTWKN